MSFSQCWHMFASINTPVCRKNRQGNISIRPQKLELVKMYFLTNIYFKTQSHNKFGKCNRWVEFKEMQTGTPVKGGIVTTESRGPKMSCMT